MEPNKSPDIAHLVGEAAVSPSPVVSQPVLGPIRNIRAFSSYEWAFLVVSVLNLLATIAFTIYSLVKIVEGKQTQSPDFTFVILLFLNAGFCLFYVFHSLLTERKYELLVFILASVIIVAYCAMDFGINFKELKGVRKTVKMVRLIIASIVAPVNIALAIKVILGFRWFEFRVIGPVEMLQQIYRRTLEYYCLLKFDLQVSLSLVILVLVNGSKVQLQEQVVLGVGVPYCILWSIVGWVAVRWELKILVAIVASLGLASPGYVVYKIYWVFTTINSASITTDERTILYITLVTCALFLIVHFIVYFELFICTRNFGLGLKEKVVQDGQDRDLPEDSPGPPTAGDL